MAHSAQSEKACQITGTQEASFEAFSFFLVHSGSSGSSAAQSGSSSVSSQGLVLDEEKGMPPGEDLSTRGRSSGTSSSVTLNKRRGGSSVNRLDSQDRKMHAKAYTESNPVGMSSIIEAYSSSVSGNLRGSYGGTSSWSITMGEVQCDVWASSRTWRSCDTVNDELRRRRLKECHPIKSQNAASFVGGLLVRKAHFSYLTFALTSSKPDRGDGGLVFPSAISCVTIGDSGSGELHPLFPSARLSFRRPLSESLRFLGIVSNLPLNIRFYLDLPGLLNACIQRFFSSTSALACLCSNTGSEKSSSQSDKEASGNFSSTSSASRNVGVIISLYTSFSTLPAEAIL